MGGCLSWKLPDGETNDTRTAVETCGSTVRQVAWQRDINLHVHRSRPALFCREEKQQAGITVCSAVLVQVDASPNLGSRYDRATDRRDQQASSFLPASVIRTSEPLYKQRQPGPLHLSTVISSLSRSSRFHPPAPTSACHDLPACAPRQFLTAGGSSRCIDGPV